ncbi:MAG: phosphate ABC transporter permease subunit PstC [Anaerolineales bacterium]
MLKYTKPLPASHPISKLQHTLQHGDIPWQVVIALASALVMLLVLAVGWTLWSESAAAQAHNGLGFLLPTNDPNWDPVGDTYQAWPFIYGTLVTSLAALVLAVPVSLGIAVFLAELCPSWLRTPLNWLVELLAAIPSVVYGLWGLFVFVPQVVVPVGNFLGDSLGQIPGLGVLFAGPIPHSGVSLLAAGMVMTIMITPTIAAVSRDVLIAIPASQREAALALGATQWETIWQVLLPYGLSGILGATILGLGRALGETMAVTMVIGNSAAGSISLLRPGYTMASIIANEFAEAVSQLHSQSLIEVGFVLFALTLLLNILARFLVWRVASKTPQEART